jgi:hypothetical protein
MKKIPSIFVLLFIGFAAMAQDDQIRSGQDNEFKTIFQRENREVFVSGFGGPMMAFTSIGQDFAHMMGGGGGVIINNFFFGGYGMGLTTSIPFKGSVSTENTYLNYGHGGLWVGYILGSNRPVHLSLSGQFGWGAISESTDNYDPGYDSDSGIPLFVITPVAEIELNFSHFFKVGVGTSVSYVRGRGITETIYTVTDFARPSVYLSFKFGWFE